MQLKSISPSRIKTFETCLFKYFLTYNMPEVKLKSNFGALNGTLIHDILQNFATKNDRDWLTRLYKGYAGLLATKDKFDKDTILESPLKWAKNSDFKDKKPFCDTCRFKKDTICGISQEPLEKLNGCPKMLFEKTIDMVEKVLKRYKALYDRPDLIIDTEYSFEIPISDTDINLIGVMDLIIKRDDETIEIIDYKSGNHTQNYEECMQDIQVRCYSWAGRKEFIEDINKKGHNFKYCLLTFDYFSASPIELACTLQQDQDTEQKLKDVIQKIRETTLIKRIIGNGDFNWQCKSMCDPDICSKYWKGNFHVEK